MHVYTSLFLKVPIFIFLVDVSTLEIEYDPLIPCPSTSTLRGQKEPQADGLKSPPTMSKFFSMYPMPFNPYYSVNKY